MKIAHIVLFLLLPLAALAPIVDTGSVGLSVEDEPLNANAKNALIVNNPNVNWTFTAGDYASFNGSAFADKMRSEMENTSEIDRAVVEWVGEMRADLPADVACSFPAYSGQCHRLMLTIRMNLTAYNDTDNWMFSTNTSVLSTDLIPTAYTGWSQSIETSYSEMWMREQGGNEDLMRSKSWQNSTTETYVTGYLNNFSVGNIWTENTTEWENWTSKEDSEMNNGGTWVPNTQTDSGSTTDQYETIHNATMETSVESPGYNTANSSGSGPTTLRALVIEDWRMNGGNNELLGSRIMGEWGFPLSVEGAPILSWRYVVGIWVDADGDGVHDSHDLCADTPIPHTDLDEDGCSWEQRDDDDDGVVNPADICAGTTAAMTDIDGDGCAWEQRDDDGDGVLNPDDYCADTPAGEQVDTEPPWVGCSASQTDGDNDGVSDANDTCPGYDDNIDVDGDGIADGCDSMIDNDGDGVNNTADLCEGFDDLIDVDQDGTPDGCDDIIDSDFDGVADDVDECMGYDDAIDEDGDGIVDGCDDIVDSDGDGVADSFEVCPGHDDNVDVDADGKPDGCDDIIDSDGDGVADAVDACAGHDDNVDVDGDGVADGCDDIIDSDSDGVADADDSCAGHDDNLDVDNDGIADGCDTLLDNDADGVANDDDDCAATPAGTEVDSTGCRTADEQSGIAGVSTPVFAGAAVGLVAVVLVVLALMMRGGKEEEPRQYVPPDTLSFGGAGMPSRRTGSLDDLYPTSGAPPPSSTPHPSQVGQVQPDGNEYLEHPPQSGNWWYRDRHTNHWQRWRE